MWAWQAKTGKKMTKTASLRDLAWFEYVGGTQGVLMRTQGIDGGQRDNWRGMPGTNKRVLRRGFWVLRVLRGNSG